MFDADYKRGIEALGPSDAQMEQVLAVLEQAEERPMKSTKNTTKTVLLAAALCAALAVTALAVELTVGWESFFGRTPKEAVTTLGTSAVTGDFTITLQEAIVDDDGATFLLALSRSDGQVLEGEPRLYQWDVKLDAEFSNMGMGEQQPIRSTDGKTVYYCVEFEAQGKEWDKASVTGKTITFQCDGVEDMDWSEEELAMTRETVSLAPLAQTARQLDASREELYSPDKRKELIPLVEECSTQVTIPLTQPGEGKAQVSAVLFSSDGQPMVTVDDWSGVIRQGQYRIGHGAAVALTDTRTGEQWGCYGYIRVGDDGKGFYLSYFKDCPITPEDLPYVEVMVGYEIDKILSDQPVELSFSAGEGHQTTVELDENIAFNYIGDCTAHVTKASISALRLKLTFDQMERSGWDWEDYKVRETQWALLEKDGTRVLLFSPIIRRDDKTGAGYIRLEGVDENNDRRLIDPSQVEALMVGDTVIPLT